MYKKCKGDKNMNDLKVVAIRRDGDGNISRFKLNDDREITFNEDYKMKNYWKRTRR